jgi:hypothetical protein
MKKIIFILIIALTLKAEEELSLDLENVSKPSEALPAKEPVSIEVPVNELMSPAVVTTPPKELTAPVIPENLKVPQLSETPRSSGSDPNVNLEEKFHKIYEDYNKTTMPLESWEKVVGKRKSETYLVQKGDTLWDISKTLFGDPFFWPKLWALNKQTIFNPHEIDPKMKILFFPGSKGEVPSLAIAEKEEKSEENSDPEPEKSSTKMTRSEESPADRKEGLSANKIPKSFPDFPEKYFSSEKSIELSERVIAEKKPVVNLEFVLSEEPIVSMGTVAEMEVGKKGASVYQNVYVKLDNAETKKFTVLRKPKQMSVAKQGFGKIFLYEIEGEVEVLNVVNSELGIYRAIVKKARTFVSKGSLLMAGDMKDFIDKDGEETSASQGKIFGNLNDNKLVGQSSFVVLNQGAQSGYTTGKIVPIFANTNSRNNNSFITENQEKIGKILIVDSTENYSVGYVLKIYQQVFVKDFVGSNLLEDSVAASSSLSGEEVISNENIPNANPNANPDNEFGPEEAPVEK